MKKGNTIRIQISRHKYDLQPHSSAHSSILLAKIIEIHKHGVSVKAFDLFASGKTKYITISREEVLSLI